MSTEHTQPPLTDYLRGARAALRTLEHLAPKAGLTEVQITSLLLIIDADTPFDLHEPQLLEACKRMDDLVEKLWPAVDWGKTFNLPAQELNEAPIAAKRAIAAAEGSE